MDRKLPTFSFLRLIALFVSLVLVFLSSETTLAQEASDNSDLIILQSDEKTTIVELTVDNYVLDQGEETADLFHRIEIAGMHQMSTPGAPELPVRATLLGVPTTDGVTLEILDAEFETLTDLRFAPAPNLILDEDESLESDAVQEVRQPDRALYTADAFYPGPLAELGEAALIRDQAVAPVRFYPVQYNPVQGETRLYRRIRIAVTWNPPVEASSVAGRASTTAFERLFEESLLNYDALPRPQVDALATPGVVTAERQSSDVTDTWKISIEKDGLYQLTYAQLVATGVPVNELDPRNITVTNQGTPVSIHVTGESDGSFDPGDTILFYGTAISGDRYTARNVYWLMIGNSNGLRMPLRSGAISGNVAIASHFPTTVHAEEDTYFWDRILRGDEAEDAWFWGNYLSPITSNSPTFRDYTIPLHNLSTETVTATVRVRLKGRTTRDHLTRILLNGTAIGDTMWSGATVFDIELSVAQSLLKEGDNIVRVQALNSGAVVDQVFVDWIEIDYWDTYVAEDDRLLFSAPSQGNHRFAVSNFGDSTIQVFDITDPTHPVLITGTTVQPAGAFHTVQFQDTATASSHYLALTPDRYLTPITVQRDNPSNWKDKSNGADYIIITHEDFYTSTLVLANHRQTQGLRVAVVKVGDLYDEFNHGIFHPSAIRNFVSYAYQNWTAPAPTYILLVGDSYYDYKDNLKAGHPVYVPSHIYYSEITGEIPSDNWFVTVVGDDPLPDLLLGRFSVNSAQQAQDLISKTIAYEMGDATAVWNRTALLVSDDDDPAFARLSDELSAKLPFYYTVNRVDAADYPPGAPATDIISAINQGASLVNYTGHGGPTKWGEWQNDWVLETGDIGQMSNDGMFPFVTIANCLNGTFDIPPTNPAMAEAFHRPRNGGAIAVWAPSGLGFPSLHRTLMLELYGHLFVTDQTGIGSVTTEAKLSAYAISPLFEDLVQTYILFGDPATNLKLPTNHPYLNSVTPADGATEAPIDQAIHLRFNKAMAQVDAQIWDEGGTNVALSLNASNDNTSYSVVHTPFIHGATYQITVSGKDAGGRSLIAGPVPMTTTFTVSSDQVAPTGMAEVEGGVTEDVPVTAGITISFTEPVRSLSVAFTIQPAVTGFLTWSDDRRTAQFTHADFAHGQTYSFTITAALDQAGNGLVAPFGVNFTTTTAAAASPVYLPLIQSQ